MKLLARILFATGMTGMFLCFLCYVGGAHPWGWTAMSGKEEDGKFYLQTKGRYREVTRSVYQSCLWQEYAAMAAVCVLLCSAGMLAFERTKKDAQPA